MIWALLFVGDKVNKLYFENLKGIKEILSAGSIDLICVEKEPDATRTELLRISGS